MTEKGSDWEREFVKECRNMGYPTARIGGSGAGSPDDLPDVMVVGDTTVYPLELKYRKKAYVRLTNDEVDALKRFGSPNSVTPLIGFRTDGRTYIPEWKIIRIPELNPTSSGYSINENIYKKSPTLSEYLEKYD